MAVENDLVLIHIEDSPAFFARVETIEPDIKKDWFHVKFLVLQVPLNTITWILRDIYIEGQPFKMNGKDVYIEKISFPLNEEDKKEEESDPPHESKEGGKVISFSDLKKKKDE